jgi:phosphoketolase
MLRDRHATQCGFGNFRVVGPDETTSNRLDALFEVT